MSEIKTPILTLREFNDNDSLENYPFDSIEIITHEHTFADIARWIHAGGGSEYVIYELENLVAKDNR